MHENYVHSKLLRNEKKIWFSLNSNKLNSVKCCHHCGSSLITWGFVLLITTTYFEQRRNHAKRFNNKWMFARTFNLIPNFMMQICDLELKINYCHRTNSIISLKVYRCVYIPHIYPKQCLIAKLFQVLGKLPA